MNYAVRMWSLIEQSIRRLAPSSVYITAGPLNFYYLIAGAWLVTAAAFVWTRPTQRHAHIHPPTAEAPCKQTEFTATGRSGPSESSAVHRAQLNQLGREQELQRQAAPRGTAWNSQSINTHQEWMEEDGVTDGEGIHRLYLHARIKARAHTHLQPGGVKVSEVPSSERVSTPLYCCFTSQQVKNNSAQAFHWKLCLRPDKHAAGN